MYLDDTLAPQDTKRVERHLLECKLCADAIEGFALYQNKTNKADLPTIEPPQTHHNTALLPKISKKWTIAAAATVCGLMVGGYYFNNNNDAIFKDYYNTMAPEQTFRSSTALQSVSKTATDSAMELFSESAYQESYPQLKSIALADKTNLKAAFFTGCAAMELKDWDEAVVFLERVHLSPNNEEYAAHSLWYLALAKLQQGEDKRAVELLQETVNSNTLWKPNAESLLEKLK